MKLSLLTFYSLVDCLFVVIIVVGHRVVVVRRRVVVGCRVGCCVAIIH